MPTISEYGTGAKNVYSTPPSALTKTVKVASVTATISSQTETSVTLAVTPTSGQLVEITYGQAAVQYKAQPAVLVMETGVNPVIAGGDRAGWISGDPANLALSATVNCLFDLGPDWQHFPLVQAAINPTPPSTGLGSITLVSSDSAASFTAKRRLGYANAVASGTIFLSLPSASATNTFMVRPMGRYLQVNLTNADAAAAQGALTAVVLTAYPC